MSAPNFLFKKTSMSMQPPLYLPADQSYDIVRQIVTFIHTHYAEQPSLAHLAHELGISQRHMTKLFKEWAGITPDSFLQAVTFTYAKKYLQNGYSVMEAALESGLSGASRLHDLCVSLEAMPPGALRMKGEGLDLTYGFHRTPFGEAVLIVSSYGLAALAFAHEEKDKSVYDSLAEMQARWSNASYTRDETATLPYIERIFDRQSWQKNRPLRITLIGTDFEIRVWQGLLNLPFGKVTSYGALAKALQAPQAARAIGRAVGHNPLSFVVPCHRVIGTNGDLTGYHWGLTRKRAMLGWEMASHMAL
jgi:AraC family transcriptional regulator, regulatory protein of adaptative response / methylated-DNA-[protein]-cysteine methyltransferase